MKPILFRMKRDEIRNNQIWARLAIFLLWLQMVYGLGAIFIAYNSYALISRHSIGFGYDEKFNILEATLIEVNVSLFIVTSLIFLIWFWQVYANFHVLHPKKATFGKVWAIIGWFLPLLNFYIPFAIMREIWLENQEETDDSLNEKRYRWVIWWWMFSLMAFVIAFSLEFFVPMAVTDTASWQKIYFMLICKYFFFTLSAATAIMLIFKINQSEQKLREKETDLDIYDHLVEK